MTKTRLEAFSDGVLAIIITIMVLELKAPHSSQLKDLKEVLPAFLSYVISFLFVGIYWGNHHHLLHSVKTIRSGLIWANMNLLFWLSLIPFATAWMGENHFASDTVMLYSILMLLCGVSFYILQFQVKKNSYQTPELTMALSALRIKGLYSVLGYALATVLAYFTPILPPILFILIAAIWFIPDRKIEKALTNQDSD